jgi:dTDP-4-dehydrorhamnose 3,5-epimerase
LLNTIYTPLAGVNLVDTDIKKDERGYFFRAFCEQELAPILGSRKIAQINISRTERVGAVRGLHFQYPPHAEMKFIRCLKGQVWDVALDLRKDSKTFLQWHAVELSPTNARMLVIPEGCAHGFQVLEAGSELLYLHTAAYEPTKEGGVRYDDISIGINWPLKPADVSERDAQFPFLPANFQGIVL